MSKKQGGSLLNIIVHDFGDSVLIGVKRCDDRPEFFTLRLEDWSARASIPDAIKRATAAYLEPDLLATCAGQILATYPNARLDQIGADNGDR